MDHACAHLAELVRINDTLSWSEDYKDSFISAVGIIKNEVGAALAPSFLVSESGTWLERVTDDQQGAVLGDEFARMPVGPYLRPPWINPGEWPVSARDHLHEDAWAVLPDAFKACVRGWQPVADAAAFTWPQEETGECRRGQAMS